MDNTTKTGAIYALFAYSIWAVAPMYLKLLNFVPAVEILAHRVIWSFVITLAIILLWRKGPALLAVLRSPKSLLALLASTALIGFNWGLFIWAINANFMLSASLGYYINPLMSILLGMIFFGERLDKVRTLAAALCVSAVVFEMIQFGQLPWIALALASSFAVYGLVRKKLGVDSLTGMALETGLLLPVGLLYLFIVQTPTSNPLNNAWWVNLLLIGAGPVSMTPLMLFAAAANRISLTALGFFQYIAPSGMFLSAVFIYGEPLSPAKLVTFGLIWLALLIISVDSLRQMRRSRRRVSDELAVAEPT
ncbi:EamA family transporter RarD [Saccharospirillum mangrovi]|uniref:EamA family transporter RarD n=1 Tax=Saccharospirillum mangrovi TaxID=2161747 RepID=UPI000D3371E8|nr:EamA family transporter RarD [Saccharospirillum mangrovi]